MKFLEELADEFIKTLGAGTVQKAKENTLNAKGKKVLKALCTKYETPASGGDKAHTVLAAVDGVKSKMQDNIAGMLKNQASAESLNTKSQELNEQASVFKKNSKTLKNTMWWKNIKTTLALGCVCIIVVAIILVPIILQVKGVFDAGQGLTYIVTGGKDGMEYDNNNGENDNNNGVVVVDLEDRDGSSWSPTGWLAKFGTN